ncbi:hypothetical protein PF010_g2549 [Phytophthora fragariae]|uniref:Uncharacterized protein n=1 Tax=Phytophthora fragariae TaxID=53985 RepID=A0A6G0LX15_9STRA|nr:hypothetical protein PF010_g2549 [Phytophthora fragariae]
MLFTAFSSTYALQLGLLSCAQDWHFDLTSFQLFNATCGQYVYFGGISLLREVVKQKYGS